MTHYSRLQRTLSSDSANRKTGHQIENFSKKKIASKNFEKPKTDMSVRNSVFRNGKDTPEAKPQEIQAGSQKRCGTLRPCQGCYLGPNRQLALEVCPQRSTPLRWSCVSTIPFHAYHKLFVILIDQHHPHFTNGEMGHSEAQPTCSISRGQLWLRVRGMSES